MLYKKHMQIRFLISLVTKHLLVSQATRWKNMSVRDSMRIPAERLGRSPLLPVAQPDVTHGDSGARPARAAVEPHGHRRRRRPLDVRVRDVGDLDPGTL